MGQRASGILYGCEAPELPPLPGDDTDEGFYGLVSEWNHANGANAEPNAMRVRLEGKGGKELVGVWVAVGGGGEDGAPHFVEDCFPLAQAETVYKQRLALAKKMFKRFAADMKKTYKIKLPEAALWLTPCETA